MPIDNGFENILEKWVFWSLQANAPFSTKFSNAIFYSAFKLGGKRLTYVVKDWLTWEIYLPTRMYRLWLLRDGNMNPKVCNQTAGLKQNAAALSNLLLTVLGYCRHGDTMYTCTVPMVMLGIHVKFACIMFWVMAPRKTTVIQAGILGKGVLGYWKQWRIQCALWLTCFNSSPHMLYFNHY